MNKKHILSGIIILISLFLFAEKNIDQQVVELEQKLANVSGQERVDVLNDIAFKLFDRFPQKGMDYANQALALSQKINYQKGAQRSLNNLGNACFSSGKYDKALEYFSKALKINEEIENKKGIAGSLNNIGVVYENMSKYDKALKCFFMSLKIREEIGDKKGIAASLNTIGNVYLGLNKYDMALEYYIKTLEIREEIGGEKGIAGSLYCIGSSYLGLSKYDKALEYYFQSLKIREEIGDKKGIADSLNTIGATYQDLCKYDKALEYHLRSLKIRKEIGDKEGFASCLVELGNAYIQLKNSGKAFESLAQGLKIAKELKSKKMITDYYESFTNYYAAKEDFRTALKYHRLYHEEDKKIFNEKTQTQINALQAGYEAEKREKEIELLKKDKELLNKDKALLAKENKIKTFTLISFVIGFILIIVVLALLFNNYVYLFTFWKKHSYIGQYRIIEKVGSGGMGMIYKAKNITDKTQTVAIKVLNEELLKDETQRKRFSRESLIIDQLKHPNIIKIYERGEDKKTSFIVMEFLAGKTLSHILPDNARLSLIDSLPIMIQISDAFVQIHGRNIIHRDLNPNNIMLIEKDCNPHFVKLLDFGLARSGLETTITQAGYALGTIRYMSPEQLIGEKDITTKSDIFSLGIVFYEMVTGTRAFSLEIGEVANDILNKLLTEPMNIRPDLPIALNQLIMCMIEKDPQARPVIENVLKTLKEIS
jgi:tetratricopeptide (TPR) repeat protein/tRNA A-37 threonylcarbamoyl transferase component Bud32